MSLLYVGMKTANDYWLEFGEDEPPDVVEVNGEMCELKSSPMYAGLAIHAYTLTGEKLARHEARTYRTNKEVAEGLAKGTYDPPQGRDVAGDKQSRESITQMNRLYEAKKNELGKPLIK